MSPLKKTIPRILFIAWFFSLAMTVCPYLCEAKAHEEKVAHSCCQKNQKEQKSQNCADADQCDHGFSLKSNTGYDNLTPPKLVASAFSGKVYFENGIRLTDVWATSPLKVPLYLIKVSLLF